MNRSKIFLGATTCLLAVAGVAATKVAKFGVTVATYYTQVQITGNVCVTSPITQPCRFLAVVTDQCFYYTAGPLHKLTTFPLFTAINPGTKCTHVLSYLAN